MQMPDRKSIKMIKEDESAAEQDTQKSKLEDDVCIGESDDKPQNCSTPRLKIA